MDTNECASISIRNSDNPNIVKYSGTTMKINAGFGERRYTVDWDSPPKTILILGKYFDDECKELMLEIANWLDKEKGLSIILPDEMAGETTYPGHSQVTGFQNLVDIIIGVGGDGTLLYVNSLFEERVPPIIPFKVGSLAFMAIFDVTEYKSVIERVLKGHFHTLSRSRLQVKVFKQDSLTPTNTYTVLNEIVIDKGPSGSCCMLDTYCGDQLITTVTGDGLIIGTSTGSTAYNLSAGGSMVHPMVDAMLFTPICPHSLSFRPVILPASVVVKIKVPEDARINPWVLFDGRHKTELEIGDYVTATLSCYPLPTVSDTDETSEWFSALARCLSWNQRERQKALPKTESKSAL